MNILLQIFLTFLKIGAFTFGGGYAMIPLIQHETVESKKWVTDEDILDIVAIAESTPGPIAINAATFVGWRRAGFAGAVCATVGVVLPSLVIITAISFVLDQFRNLKALQYAFMGLRAGVLALIFKAFWGMFKKSKKTILNCCISAGVFILAALLQVNVLLVIVLSACTGLIASAVRERRKGK